MAVNTTAQYVELQQFIVERVAAWSPDSDVSPGSRLFSAVIEPLMRRLGTDPLSTDLTTFAVQKIAEAFPEEDIYSPGSTYRDVLISAFNVLLEPLRREIEQERSRRSLREYASLTSDEIDALLANVLGGLRRGEYCYTTVRVFFGTQRAVGVDQSVRFSTASGIAFIPMEARVYQAADLQRMGNLWFLDVSVQSTQPVSGTTVARDTVRIVEGIDGVIRCTNLVGASGGLAPETNEEAIERAQRSLTERSLNTYRGIEASLRENVEGITSVSVVGFGDAEMQRDILETSVQSGSEALPGATLLATTDFGTVVLVCPQGEHTAGIMTLIPASNVVRVGTGTSQARAEALLAAKFLVFTDAAGRYQNLGGDGGSVHMRARRVAEAAITDTSPYTVTFRLEDFSVYPEPASMALADAGTAVQTDFVSTQFAEAPFNPYPVQGTAYRLYAEDTDTSTVYPIGAPLPFTDVVRVTTPDNFPADIVFGRDYLVFTTKDDGTNPSLTTAVLDGSTAARPSMAHGLHVFPLHEYLGDGLYRVARIDAHLLTRRATQEVPSTGWPEGSDLSAVREVVEVIAFGGPAAGTDPAASYDGETVDAWGSHAGATLTATITGTLTSAAQPCDVSLHTSMPTWEEMGVRTGHYISLALCADVTGGAVTLPAFAGALEWQGWGLITGVADRTLTVVGVDWTALFDATVSTANGTIQNVADLYFDAPEYRLYWTVYVGARDLVDQTGAQVTSYDEAAFLPALVYPQAAERRVAARWLSSYAGRTSGRGWQSDTVSSTLLGWRVDAQAWSACMLRLGAPFDAYDITMQQIPSAALLSAIPVDLSRTTDLVAGDVSGNAISAATKLLYQQARFPGSLLDTELYDGGSASDKYLTVRVALPLMAGYLPGLKLLSDPGASAFDPPHEEHPYRTSGFLLPHMTGPANTGSTNTYLGQIISGLGEIAAADVDAQVVVSGIRGGLPFLDAYGTPVVVASGDVHIGGATDVYVKTATPQEVVLAGLRVTSNETDSARGCVADVADASISDADLSCFVSVDAAAAISGYLDYTLGDEQVSTDLCVEFLDLPDAVSPRSFRIIATDDAVPGRIIISGEIIGLTGSLTGLRVRVLQSARVYLNTPITLVQQGTDLSSAAGSDLALLADGVLFADTVASNTLMLYATYAGGEHAHQVIRKYAGYLQVTPAFPRDITGGNYRIGRLQANGISVPVVRASSLSIGSVDGDYSTTVPHCGVVDATLVNSVSRDDAVLDDATVGEVIVATTLGVAVITADPGIDFAALGVRTGDAVVFLGFADADRYFYVVSFPDTNELALDRALTSPVSLSSSNFKIGRPSISTLRAYTLDRSFISLPATARASHTAADGVVTEFIPSTTEEGVLYAPRTHVPIAALSTASIITAESGTDFLALGIRVGDTVETLSRVLQSTQFLGAARLTVATGGSLLAVAVDDQVKLVSLYGGAYLSIDAVAALINQQLADDVYASEVFDGVGYRLQIGSWKEIQLVAARSSVGLVAALGFGSNYDSVAPTGIATRSAVTEVTATTITIAATLPESSGGIYFRVVRSGEQRVYPADMLQDDTGLFYADFRVVSRAPAGYLRTVDAGSQVALLGAYTYGYRLRSGNSAYSYSTLEQLYLETTGCFLPEYATDMSELLPIPGSRARLAYETAPEVEAAQAFVRQPAVRVLNSSTVVKHYLPAYPLFAIRYTGAPTEDAVRAALADYFIRLYPNRAIDKFELFRALDRLEITRATLPDVVSFLTFDAERTPAVHRSDENSPLPSSFHIMGETDFVVLTRGV